METKVTVLKQWSLQGRDFIRGLVIAVISPVFTILIQSLQAEEVTVNWKSIMNVAIIAFLTYISKNLAEPTKAVVSAPTPEVIDNVKQAVK